MVAGRLGMIVCAVSQSGYLRLTFSTDEVICDDKTTKRILQMLRDNIMQEIERTKDMTMPESPEKKKTK